MKIVQADAGVLTNFEVLDLLRSRGATIDPMGCLGAVEPSECKVFDYLIHTAACNQNREVIDEFMKRSETFKVAKALKLNFINMRPSNQPEAEPIIALCEKEGLDNPEEFMNMVIEVLPPAPPRHEDGNK
uniref:DNA-directed RNA polymerase III subunit RPC9 n=1 Tax=Anthurium amnicola TaxID=1678845 RepID=A0A1D1Y934_9ARAE